MYETFKSALIEAKYPVLEAKVMGLGTWLKQNMVKGLKAIGKSSVNRETIEVSSNSPRVWYERGNVLYELHRFEQAIESHDKAIAIQSDYPYAWSGRGSALYMLNRYDEAIESHDEAIAIQSDYPYAWSGRGSALYMLNSRSDELQKDSLKKSLAPLKRARLSINIK